ncbi:MAG: L,D-transpeptidase family protein [Hyphomicrobiaceae bacterium]
MSVRVFGILAMWVASIVATPAYAYQKIAAAEPEFGVQPIETLAPLAQRELLINEILRQITRRKTEARSSSRHHRLDQLGTLYSQPNPSTYWVTGNKVRSNIAAIQDEFAQADYWGLDATAFKVPQTDYIARGDIAALADVEIAMSLVALKYANHALGGRVDPTKLSLWLNRGPRRIDTGDFLDKLANSTDPAKVLQNLHPKHPQFAVLLEAYRQRKYPGLHKVQKTDADLIIPRGPKIKQGSTHPQIGLIRRRLGVPVTLATDYYDKPLADAVAKVMRKKRWKYRKTTIDKYVRRALNEGPKKRRAQLKEISVRKLVINMDRWRRMPEKLGRLHFVNNIPSYETRLYKDGALVHKERIIVGKPNTQTPVFSDTMDHVVFKPNWGVPSSIKIRQLLPRLRGGDYSVLSRRNMRIIANSGRTLSPRRFNWSRVSISDIPIYQGPGRGNPLGEVKFMFPNRHSVYMHDTPKKSLFKSKARAFSHGCIRVRNPKRLAEVLFREINGWDKEQVYDHWHRRAESNKRVELNEKIRVHMTYFTLVVNDQGVIESYKDLYRHDRNISKVMDGTSVKAIAKIDPARLQKQQLKQLVKSGYSVRSSRASARLRRRASRLGVAPPPGFIDYPGPKKYVTKKYKKKKYRPRRHKQFFHRSSSWTPF